MEHSADHDLLIEIKTKLTNVIEEMRLMRDDTKEQVKNLYATKVNQADFNEYKAVAITDSTRKDIELKAHINDVRLNFTQSIDGLDERQDTIEKDMKILAIKGATIGGAIAVLAFFVPYIIKIAFPSL